jgi:hypothetical protein
MYVCIYRRELIHLQKYAVNNRLAQTNTTGNKSEKERGKSKDVLPAIRNGQTTLLVGESAACILLNERLALRRCIRQNTSAYVSIRQHTSAYASIRQHKSA